MRRKKIAAIILTALLAASIFAGCSNDTQPTQGGVSVSSKADTENSTEYQLSNVSFRVDKEFENYAKNDGRIAFRKNNSGVVREGLTFFVSGSEYKDIENKDTQSKIVDELKTGSASVEEAAFLSSKEETIGKIKGLKVNVKASLEEETAFMNTFLFNCDDGIMGVSYVSKDKNTSQLDKELNKIINTIEFREKVESASLISSESGEIEYSKEIKFDDTNKANFYIMDKENEKNGIIICEFDGENPKLECARVVVLASAMQDKKLKDYNIAVKSSNDYASFIWKDGELSSSSSVPKKYQNIDILSEVGKDKVLSEQDFVFSQLGLSTSASTLSNNLIPNSTEKILMNKNGRKITYTGISKGIFDATEINLLIENNTSKNYIIQVRDVSVNEFMVEPIFSSKVASGKKAKDAISFRAEDIDSGKIDSLEFKFIVANDDDFSDNFYSDIIKLNP